MQNQSPVFDDSFIRRWRPALMAFFVRRTQNRAEAEDLTQEVLMKLLSSEGTDVPPDAYIFKTAQNLLIDRSRKSLVRDRHRDTVRQNPEAGQDMLDPHRIAESRQTLATLISALNELPERTRTIFLLFKIEHLSQESIGAAFGISESAVKQQVAKALAHLTKTRRQDP